MTGKAIFIVSAALGTILGAALCLRAVPAQAETWCLRGDGPAATGRICAFTSAQDCLQTARVNSAGNICEQEGAASAKSGRKTDKTPDKTLLRTTGSGAADR
jgi:hypothetical protein